MARKTGELDLFKEIWAERPHICKECGCHLGYMLAPHFFSHYISKGSEPALRLDKENIDLLCFKHHHQWDHGDRKKMKIYDEDRIAQLKLKAHKQRTTYGYQSE